MSLINQMLKDLESRQNQKSTEKNSAISGLSPARDKKQPAVNKKFLIAVIPIFIFLIYEGWGEWSKLLNSKDAAAVQNASTTPAAAAPAANMNTTPTPVETPMASAAPVSAPVVPPPAATGSSQAVLSAIVNDSTAPSLQDTTAQAALPPALNPQAPLMNELTDVKINIDDKMASIDMAFKSPVYYDFDRNPALSVVSLKVFNVMIDSKSLNNFPNNAYIQNVKVEQVNNDSIMFVTMRDGVELATLDVTQSQGKYLVSLQFQNRKNFSNSLNSSMQKVVVPLTADQLAEKAREDAITLVEQGKMQEAIDLLSQSIVSLPSYRPTRETLAILLMDQNHPTTAETLLNAGIAESPKYVPFVILKSRILLAKGDYDAAMSLLETVSPNIKDEPEYFALLAGLQQQKGEFGVAEQIYRQLVLMHPDNGTYWMGFAVALENGGQQNRAVEAYKQAIISGNLSSTLQIYANDRLSLLGG